MKQKFGIKKTKMNIFWLFIFGLLAGVVIGLRSQGPTPIDEQTPVATEIVSEK